jgi:SIR2-like domain
VPSVKDYRIVRVADCGSELESRRPAGFVFLVGSLISTYTPTNLPIGAHITNGLWNFIFGDGWPQWLKRDFSLLPFETIMQCYPDRAHVRTIVRQLFQTAPPNLIHQRLIAGLLGRAIDGLVTTNYDRAFEMCVSAQSAVHAVTTCADAHAYRNTPPSVRPQLIFKIHGTAREDLESTLVCDLEAEGRLPSWKRDLLSDLIRGRTVVVIGYSGRDFDICPELADSDVPIDVVWLQRSRQDLQPNAERVMQRRRGVLVLGDLVPFIEVVLGEKVSVSQQAVSWRFGDNFDQALVVEWQGRLLEWMACPALVERLAINRKGDEISALVESAAFAKHAGAYYTGAHILGRIVRIPSLGRRQRLTAVISTAEAWFMYGRHWRAWRMLRRVERQLTDDPEDNELKALAAELRLIIHMRASQFAQRFRFAGLQERIRRKSLDPYELAWNTFENNGAWRRLASVRQNAERIGIADIAGLPLPAAKGYASLGLISMDVIAKRDWIRSGEMTKARQNTTLLYAVFKRQSITDGKPRHGSSTGYSFGAPTKVSGTPVIASTSLAG